MYDELRRLAVARMAREQPGQTQQAMALVHKACMRIVGDDQEMIWLSYAHIFKEDLIELIIVILPGMHQCMLYGLVPV